MSAKLVTLNRAPSIADALSAVDALRADLESGKAIAFVGVAITPDDTCMAYCGSVRPVSRLRMQGAIGQLDHDWRAGDV
jgi:hypothetical protein